MKICVRPEHIQSKGSQGLERVECAKPSCLQSTFWSKYTKSSGREGW